MHFCVFIHVQENLLRICRCHSRIAGLLTRYLCLGQRVEVVSQVNQTGLILNLLQNLRLPVHHVLVFKDLFDGNYFASRSYLSLHQVKFVTHFVLTYLEDFAEGTATKHLLEHKLVKSALGL